MRALRNSSWWVIVLALAVSPSFALEPRADDPSGFKTAKTAILKPINHLVARHSRQFQRIAFGDHTTFFRHRELKKQGDLIRQIRKSGAEPWIISSRVVVTEPMSVGHVIIVSGGSLTVLDLPEPGFQVEGNVWAIGDGRVRFENSVIQFLSTHHGQFALAGTDNAQIEVIGCDYRVPNEVQHGLVIGGQGRLLVEDTNFDPVQLLSADTAHFTARRLNGDFEVIVQHDSMMTLIDIPRDLDAGKLWVWVEFPQGSETVYSPPLPGFIDSWSFPPEDAAGIEQRVTIDRCETLLWAMLVREGCILTLRDIIPDNWIVVGFYMPNSSQVTGLQNQMLYEDSTLDMADREIRLVNASIDTWNLYPEDDASIVMTDSLVGEVLSFDSSTVRIERSTIDGTGGFFGARGNSHIRVFDSVFTCTIEATQDTTIELHNCAAEPYPLDTTGVFTRFGAYERGLLFANKTAIYSTPALDGEGAIAVTFFVDPPTDPPIGDQPLYGSAAVFSLEDGPSLRSWRLDAIPILGGSPVFIEDGMENLEEGLLGVWSNANPNYDHLLRITLEDNFGRTLTGLHRVPGTGNGSRDPGAGTRLP